MELLIIVPVLIFLLVREKVMEKKADEYAKRHSRK